MSTAIALYDAQGILATLLETRDDTICAICSKTLGAKSYLICRFPDAPAGTRGLPKEHEGHTACEACATDRTLYVGEGGSCRACFTRLGGRRTAVAKSGVALIPAVLNSMANTMMSGFLAAERRMEEARDAAEDERIQEGTDRRVAAVEERREAKRRRDEEEARRREEAAEAEAARLTEEARERAEEEARRHAEEVKTRAEEEAKRLREEAEAEARRLTEEAKEDARLRTEFEARERELRIEKEDRERAERHRLEDASRDTAAPPTSSSTTRKRKPQSQDTIEKRREKARATREAQRHKVQHFDAILAERDLLQEKLKAVVDMARRQVASLNGDADKFEDEVDAHLLTMDGYNEEGEEEEEEEQREEEAAAPAVD